MCNGPVQQQDEQIPSGDRCLWAPISIHQTPSPGYPARTPSIVCGAVLKCSSAASWALEIYEESLYVSLEIILTKKLQKEIKILIKNGIINSVKKRGNTVSYCSIFSYEGFTGLEKRSYSVLIRGKRYISFAFG